MMKNLKIFLMIAIFMQCGFNQQLYAGEKTYSKKTVAGFSILGFILGMGSFAFLKNLYKKYLVQHKKDQEYTQKIYNIIDTDLETIKGIGAYLNNFITKNEDTLGKVEVNQLKNNFNDINYSLKNLKDFLSQVLSIKIPLDFTGKNKKSILSNQFEAPSKDFFDIINNELVNYLREINIPTGEDPKALALTGISNLHNIVKDYSRNIISLYLKADREDNAWGSFYNKKQDFDIRHEKDQKNINIQKYVLNSKKSITTAKYVIGTDLYSKTKERFSGFKDISLKNFDNAVILKDGIYKVTDLSDTLELTPQ